MHWHLALPDLASALCGVGNLWTSLDLKIWSIQISHIGNSACSSLTIIVGQHRGKGGMLLPSVNRHSPRDGTTHKKAQCHNPAAAAEHKRTRHPCERTPPVESGGDATGNAPFLSQPPLRGAHPSGNCTTRLHAAVAAARVSRTQRVAYGSRGKEICVPAKM